MRIAIIGSRHFANPKYVLEQMAHILDSIEVERQAVCFVTGGAKSGVDNIIKVFAAKGNVPHVEYEPHFVVDKSSKYTPRDFFTRNRQIVNNCDMLIAFVDPTDTGTLHAVAYADKKGKPVFTVDLEGATDEGTGA